MVVSFEYELVTFFISIALAFSAGILYDFSKALRKCTGMTLLWDIVLWLSVSFLVGFVWFFLLDGEVRWYMITGAFFAGVIYFISVSKYVFLVLSLMMDGICRIFRIIFKILLTPLAFLCKIICVYVKKANFGFSRKVEEKYDEKEA